MKKYEINLNGKIILSIVLPSVVFFFHVHEATVEIDDVLFKLQEMFNWVKSNSALNDDYSHLGYIELSKEKDYNSILFLWHCLKNKKGEGKRCGGRFYYLLVFLLRFLS
jgi:hypothetical protein